MSATYGLHNKIDIAAIVPFGSARVSGFASGYQMEAGVEDAVRTDSSGSSFGIGDILVRTKVALIASDSFDAAAAVDIRLPTGDPEKLLGTGFTQARVMFIGGTTLGSVNPHINVGYTFGGEGMVFGADNRWEGSFGDPELISRQPSEEFNYTAGVDIAATRAHHHRRRHHRTRRQELSWDGIPRQRTGWQIDRSISRSRQGLSTSCWAP